MPIAKKRELLDQMFNAAQRAGMIRDAQARVKAAMAAGESVEVEGGAPDVTTPPPFAGNGGGESR